MSYPHLWIPRAQILEPRDALALPRTGKAGRFRIRGRKADGRERLIADWQPNLILDAGLERIGTAPPFGWCALGSSGATPTADQTAIGALVASAATSSATAGVQEEAPYFGFRTLTTVFDPPGAARVISELGWGWEADGSALWSRALILDEGSSPAAFQWLADESLTIDYEVRNYPWLTDLTGDTSIGGTTYACTVRAARVAALSRWKVLSAPQELHFNAGGVASLPTAHDGALNGILADPGGTAAGASSATADAYSAGSRKRTGSATWEGGVANYAGGITAVLMYSRWGCWKIGFDPPIAKTAGKILTLNLESPTWGRQP